MEKILKTIEVDEHKQVKVMIEKAMKKIEEPLKALLGSNYKPVYLFVLFAVLIIIIILVIWAIVQPFLA